MERNIEKTPKCAKQCRQYCLIGLDLVQRKRGISLVRLLKHYIVSTANLHPLPVHKLNILLHPLSVKVNIFSFLTYMFTLIPFMRPNSKFLQKT